jgi:hypothetical protein
MVAHLRAAQFHVDVLCQTDPRVCWPYPTITTRTRLIPTQISLTMSSITIDNYLLYADEQNWIVAKVVLGKSGRERRLHHRYYPRLEQALKHLAEVLLRNREWHDLAELCDAVADLHNQRLGGKEFQWSSRRLR